MSQTWRLFKSLKGSLLSQDQVRIPQHNTLTLTVLSSPTSSITTPKLRPWACACLLSHFSYVPLCATLWTTAHRLPCPWDSPGKNAGVGCCTLLLRVFSSQRSNPSLFKSTCVGRRVLYHWRHLGSPALSPALLNYLLLIAWTHHHPYPQRCSLCTWMMPLPLHHHLDTTFPPLRAGPSAEDTLLGLINDRTIFSILALGATGLFHSFSVY